MFREVIGRRGYLLHDVPLTKTVSLTKEVELLKENPTEQDEGVEGNRKAKYRIHISFDHFDPVILQHINSIF